MTGRTNRHRTPDRSWQLPGIIVRCPACGTDLGRTTTLEARDRALLTHRKDCSNASDPR